MSNPIRPIGRPRADSSYYYNDGDIFAEALRQDLERNGGVERQYNNPLVDENPSRDVATDGDSYANLSGLDPVSSRDFAENAPSEIVDGTNSANSRITLGDIPISEDVRRVMGSSLMRDMQVEEDREIFRAINSIVPRIPAVNHSNSYVVAERQREEAVRLENAKSKKELEEAKIKAKEKYGNAISGLEL